MAPLVKIPNASLNIACLNGNPIFVIDSISKANKIEWTTLIRSHSGWNSTVIKPQIHNGLAYPQRGVNGLNVVFREGTDSTRKMISSEYMSTRPVSNEWGILNKICSHEEIFFKTEAGEGNESAKGNMRIAAPFLIALAAVLVFVVLYILYGKMKIYFARRKKDRVFAMLVGRGIDPGYGTMWN